MTDMRQIEKRAKLLHQRVEDLNNAIRSAAEEGIYARITCLHRGSMGFDPTERVFAETVFSIPKNPKG